MITSLLLQANESIVEPMADTLICATTDNSPLQEVGEISPQFTDSLMRAVRIVGNNTDSFAGWSLLVTILAVFASLITIIGFLSIINEFKKHKTSRECQEKIILDLIRHFFINNAITEAIRYRISQATYSHKEGILDRFCVLDSDIELKNLPYTAENYEMLHSLRVRLRNYNSVALIAERHFCDKTYKDSTKIEDLDEIWERSVKLTKDFIEYAKSVKLHIDEDVVRTYIADYYNRPNRIPEWKSKGLLDYSIQLLPRSGSYRPFYDEKPYFLSEIMDACILHRLHSL